MTTITVQTIRNKSDHKAAVNRLVELMKLAPPPNSPEKDEMNALAGIIEAWEKEHNPPIDSSGIDAIDYILFFMDQNSLRNKDMSPYFGTPARASEVLNRKRPLTLQMVKKLHEGLHIPLELLIKDVSRNMMAS